MYTLSAETDSQNQRVSMLVPSKESLLGAPVLVTKKLLYCSKLLLYCQFANKNLSS